MQVSKLSARLNLLLENNMAYFAKRIDSGREARSKDVVRYYGGLSKTSKGDAVIRWEVPSQRLADVTYSVFVEVIPSGASLFALASAGNRRLVERMEILKNADVKCFCSCPDFNWSGMKYNLKHREDSYSVGHQSEDGIPDGSDIPPYKKDPKGRNLICKHIHSVFKGMLTNAGTIMKEAAAFKSPQAAQPVTPAVVKPTATEPPQANVESSMSNFFEVTVDDGNGNTETVNVEPILEAMSPLNNEATGEAMAALALNVDGSDGSQVETEITPEEAILNQSSDEGRDDSLFAMDDALRSSMFTLGMHPSESDTPET